MKTAPNPDKQTLDAHRATVSEQAHEAYQLALMSDREAEVRDAVLRAWIVALNHSSKNDLRIMRFGPQSEVAEFADGFIKEASNFREADLELYNKLEPELHKGTRNLFWKFNGVAEHPLDQQLVDLGLAVLPDQGDRFNLLRKVGWVTLTILVAGQSSAGLAQIEDKIKCYGGSVLVFNQSIVQSLQLTSVSEVTATGAQVKQVPELVSVLTEE